MAMLSLVRTFGLSVAFAFALAPARASDDGVTLGGFICVRPFAPACADIAGTYRTKEKVAACQNEIEQFAVAAVAYRDCLERQIGSALRQTNDVIDRFRCLSERGAPCVTAKLSPSGKPPRGHAD